jgi:Tol biopolymer transport system component
LWLIPVAGGTAQRLTSLGITSLAADYSPDGAHIAFIGSNGTYIMNADGSGLTQIDNNPKFGTIQWAK